jgi:hypothetical protein
LAQRGRIVLLSTEGLSNTVIGWRERYQLSGLAGLDYEARSGRPRTSDHREVVAAPLTPPPGRYGVSHWSSRLLGRHLGIGDATVAWAWREYRVRPWRSESFRFSADPDLVAKVTDVVGLYVASPENAVVLRLNEKSQIQADRTAPILPLQHRLAERRSHDYLRRATILFVTLEIATAHVTAGCKPRPRNTEFLAFLKQVAVACQDVESHLVMDNYAADKHPAVRTWLTAHPRVGGIEVVGRAGLCGKDEEVTKHHICVELVPRA